MAAVTNYSQVSVQIIMLDNFAPSENTMGGNLSNDTGSHSDNAIQVKTIGLMSRHRSL